ASGSIQGEQSRRGVSDGNRNDGRHSSVVAHLDGGGSLAGDLVWHNYAGLTGVTVNQRRRDAVKGDLCSAQCGGDFATRVKLQPDEVRGPQPGAEDGDDLAGRY